MNDTHDVVAALARVRAEIDALARRYDRAPDSVQLLAVSKTKPAAAVEAALEAGQTRFGENHLQDAMTKITVIPRHRAQWHFIGPVQSNKTRAIAEYFDWCQSIDREKIAVRLSQQRPGDLPPLQVCLQVNIDGEDTKAGLAPNKVLGLAAVLRELPGLTLRGLMAIPRPRTGLAAQREPHRRLAELAATLRGDGYAVDTLSIGMSDDIEAAIAEGATMVRIGTAIFGARAKAAP